jgi:hypothetical protein
MPFAGKWMELEIIMLSEISQTQKEICFLTHAETVLKNDMNKKKRKYLGGRVYSRKEGGDNRVTRGISMMNVHCVQNCYNEIHYFRQFF